jgi:hypothetical protein
VDAKWGPNFLMSDGATVSYWFTYDKPMQICGAKTAARCDNADRMLQITMDMQADDTNMQSVMI